MSDKITRSGVSSPSTKDVTSHQSRYNKPLVKPQSPSAGSVSSEKIDYSTLSVSNGAVASKSPQELSGDVAEKLQQSSGKVPAGLSNQQKPESNAFQKDIVAQMAINKDTPFIPSALR